MTVIYLSIPKETGKPEGYDLRTREGREAEVIQQVTEFGGFSVFWATENQKRAHAIDRLQQAGRIKPGAASFPWCKYTLTP